MDTQKRIILIASFALIAVLLTGFFVVRVAREQSNEEASLKKRSAEAKAQEESERSYQEFQNKYRNVFIDGTNVDQVLADAQKEIDSGDLIGDRLGRLKLYQGQGLRVKSVNSTDSSIEKQNLINSIQVLYGIFTDEAFTMNMRSRAIQEMDSDIEQACFRYDWLAEALSSVDGGAYYRSFESKLPANEPADRREGDIGRLMAMDMNQKADKETPDVIFKFWKFYISGNALSGLKTGGRLSDADMKARILDIKRYDADYRAAPASSFIQTKYTEMWERTSVLSIRSRLASLFPGEFVVDKNEIFKDFDQLIVELENADKTKRAIFGAEYIVRMHYALERFRYDKTDPMIGKILDPITKPEFLTNASGIRRFIRGGATRTDIVTFVEMREMAKTQPALKTVLIQAGWKFD